MAQVLAILGGYGLKYPRLEVRLFAQLAACERLDRSHTSNSLNPSVPFVSKFANLSPTNMRTSNNHANEETGTCVTDERRSGLGPTY